jgi:DHA1 family multidrug resistance protein-like MFS transporter
MFVRYLSQVFRDPRLMAFSVVIITYYIMLALFSLILPLYASDRFASKDDIGMLFTGNAVLMIAAQYPLLALFSRYLRSPQVAFIGLLLTVAGIGSAAFAGGFAYLMAVTLIIFTLGQILIMPSIDTVVADYAPSGLAASYQGFAGLAAAVGGIIGNTMGGTVYGWAREHGWISHVWVVYFMIGLSGCIIYVLICRSKPSNYREWAAESQKLRTTKK